MTRAMTSDRLLLFSFYGCCDSKREFPARERKNIFSKSFERARHKFYRTLPSIKSMKLSRARRSRKCSPLFTFFSHNAKTVNLCLLLSHFPHFELLTKRPSRTERPQNFLREDKPLLCLILFLLEKLFRTSFSELCSLLNDGSQYFLRSL